VGTSEMRVGELLDRATAELEGEAVIELNRDVLRELECPECGKREEVLTSLGKVAESKTRCPACDVLRVPHVFSQLDRDCGLLEKTFAEIGVPPFEILVARSADREVAFVFDGDAATVLGESADVR
jgi:hypothetical protein